MYKRTGQLSISKRSITVFTIFNGQNADARLVLPMSHQVVSARTLSYYGSTTGRRPSSLWSL